jgi:hypothetical protein
VEPDVIDISTEKLLSVKEIARLLPPTRGGRPTHVSTVLRWILHGTRGRRLEAVRIGKNWFSSFEALSRFAEASPTTPIPSPASDRSLRVRRTKADETLDELGL